MTDTIPALAQALTEYHLTLEPHGDNGHLIIILGYTNQIIIYQEDNQIIISRCKRRHWRDTKDITIPLADPELINKIKQIIEEQSRFVLQGWSLWSS